MIKLNKWSLKR